MVHHADYLNGLDDHALCGASLQNPTASTQVDVADARCPDCEAQLVVYQLEWWRAKALAATAELDALRAKYPELVQSADTGSPDVPAAEVEQDQATESGLAQETTFLDRARRELTEALSAIRQCRSFLSTEERHAGLQRHAD